MRRIDARQGIVGDEAQDRACWRSLGGTAQQQGRDRASVAASVDDDFAQLIHFALG
jgi:hypothetical protein